MVLLIGSIRPARVALFVIYLLPYIVLLFGCGALFLCVDELAIERETYTQAVFYARTDYLAAPRSENVIFCFLSAPILSAVIGVLSLTPFLRRVPPIAFMRLCNIGLAIFGLIVIRKNIKHRIAFRAFGWRVIAWAAAASIAFIPPAFLDSMTFTRINVAILCVSLQFYFEVQHHHFFAALFGFFAATIWHQTAVYLVVAPFIALRAHQMPTRSSTASSLSLYPIAILSTLVVIAVAPKPTIHPANLIAGLATVGLLLAPATAAAHRLRGVRLSPILALGLLLGSVATWTAVAGSPVMAVGAGTGPFWAIFYSSRLVQLGLVACAHAGAYVLVACFKSIKRAKGDTIPATMMLAANGVFLLLTPGLPVTLPLVTTTAFVYAPSLTKEAVPRPFYLSLLVTIHQITSIVAGLLSVGIAVYLRFWGWV
ncbi:hypothetical protein J8273_4238 [Carpediemonas membranifera]|uniref:Uncharacterized protein n=1 Tax=Carpediemonas membranifera TaxID=201153 RepID=A0A8J6E2B9_9EUKA|nr:hypothetical protein J8273_4238 [Carpediemonas membranifera]|eukprot:KAG9394136.1 hypothetical protein J8273_4238 [Carpediemonas membranifera]